MAHVNIHFRENSVHHLREGAFGRILISLTGGRHMNGVQCFESHQKCTFMHFRINSDDDS